MHWRILRWRRGCGKQSVVSFVYESIVFNQYSMTTCFRNVPRRTHWRHISIVLSCLAFGHFISWSQYNDESNFRVYRQYCLENGCCTDTLLWRVVIRDQENYRGRNSALRHYEVDTLSRLNPEGLDSRTVIQQFFHSLQVLNICFVRDEGCSCLGDLGIGTFFDSDHLKKHYKTKLTIAGTQSLCRIKNIRELTTYNFGQKITSIAKRSTVAVYFPGSSASIKMSEEFYEKIFFPRYINFIAVNHRVTPYQVEVSNR